MQYGLDTYINACQQSPDYPACACERGKVIVVGVHIYVYYVYMFVDKKSLNSTLAIDSPFQTFMVGLLVEFRLSPLPLKCFPRRVNQGFCYNITCTLLCLFRRMTQLRSHKCIGKYCHLAN